MLAGMSIFVAMKTERGLIYALFSGTERRLVEKPRDFDPFGHAGLSPLVTI